MGSESHGASLLYDYFVTFERCVEITRTSAVDGRDFGRGQYPVVYPYVVQKAVKLETSIRTLSQCEIGAPVCYRIDGVFVEPGAVGIDFRVVWPTPVDR